MRNTAQKFLAPPLALNPQLAELLGEKIRVLFESTFEIDTKVGQFRIASPHESKDDADQYQRRHFRSFYYN